MTNRMFGFAASCAIALGGVSAVVIANATSAAPAIKSFRIHLIDPSCHENSFSAPSRMWVHAGSLIGSRVTL